MKTQFFSFGLTLNWLVLTVFSFAPSVQAQLISPPIVFKQPDPPPVGNPPDTSSGVDRNPCTESAIPFSAIAPTDPTFWAITVEESPEFWFYVPYTPEQIESATLKLLDEEGNVLERKSVQVTGTPGIVRLPSPTPLVRDRVYLAQFSLDFYCSETSPLETKFVRVNAMKRELPTALAEQLTQADTLEEKAILYAESGFWYDVLMAIAQLEGEKATTGREQLFGSVGLADFSALPLTQCCFPVESMAE
ncbi:MAG: DUF928 domain-containing protein [Cyanobacteriota bacterium]|nr:DUF928 domain-containing protein [Cyanobacteriota bacterium]